MEREPSYRVMDLKALRCFWALGKRGTLTGAGIELGISEPAVSKRIRSLEGYLGKKLYESTGGRVRLTGAGQKLLEMSVGLFDRLEEFEQGLGPDSEVTGTVTVAAEDAEQLYLMPPIVDKYNRLFPGVELRLLMRPVSEAVEHVRQNEVDIGIVPKLDFPDGLAFYPWRTFEAYLVMPLGHPLVRSARTNFKSLLNRETLMRYPLILSETQELKHHRLREALAALGLPINVAFVVGSMEALKRYITLGLGVAVVSGICLTEEDQAKLAIVQVPPEYGGQTTYGVLIHQRKHIDAPLKGLLSLLEVSFSQAGNK
jgi:DNA-binding transcriptional LysR family regulator